MNKNPEHDNQHQPYQDRLMRVVAAGRGAKTIGCESIQPTRVKQTLINISPQTTYRTTIQTGNTHQPNNPKQG